jgi:predicted dehydrogenase
MARPYRLIQVGTGGMGERWCSEFLPDHVAAGNVEVVGAVDVDPDALSNAREHLGVDDDRWFTDAREAFAALDADCCTVVVPPAFHEDIVDAAVEHDLHVLSEKPIAEDLEASVRIARKIENAGLKMGVTMSHRFRKDITTLRRRVRSEESGPLDYLVGRLLCSYREYGDWGAFRHDMDDPLLLDGAVHHLDLLADMAGGRCTRLYAETWLPEWGAFADDGQALVTMRFEDGTRVSYEGALTNASALNCWGDEYVRAECRDETLVLAGGDLERHGLDADTDGEGTGGELPLDDRAFWSHGWLIEQFVDWLDGGDAMPTNVRDNLQSMALVEAAIESGTTGEPVDPQALLANAKETVDV